MAIHQYRIINKGTGVLNISEENLQKITTPSEAMFISVNPPNELMYSNDFSDGTMGENLVNSDTNTIDWVVEANNGDGDVFSIKSTLPIHNQLSSVSFTIVPKGYFTLLTFVYQQTMEDYPFDSLRVLVNGVEYFHGNNTTPWVEVSIELFGEEDKIITFKNQTDGSTLITPNTVWIDNIKVYNLPQEFDINTRGAYSNNVVFKKHIKVEGDSVVAGTSHIKDLVVSGESSEFSGRIVVNDGHIVQGIRKYFVASCDNAPTLAQGEVVYTFGGGGQMTTATVTDSYCLQQIGIRVPNPDGEFKPDHATDGAPYSFISLSKGNVSSVFLSTQPKTMGASQIASRLQVGRFGLVPNQADMNTLRVYGNILVDANEANVGTGVVGLEVVGEVVATKFRVADMNTAPASATATGTKGDIRYTSDYIYVCIATNTWKRSALTTW